MTRPFENTLPCGCRAWIENDELHVEPCSTPGHARVLAEEAIAIADRLGIAVDEL